MAPFSGRKLAPAWPPLKETYKRLDDDDNIQLTIKYDIDAAATTSSTYLTTPSPRIDINTPKSKWPQGWRGGAKIAFCGSITVLTINIVLLLAMTLAFPRMDGMSMIYMGNCTKTESINTGIHFVVNVLSTGLLAASSYCMQILSAPTRKEIDKAHATMTWMDIGIASIRNLRMLRKQKIILWWLLAMSAIPLHLFYNSVFFTAIATNDYNVLYATEDFVRGSAYDRQRFPDTKYMNVSSIQSQARTFERLDNAACINAYALDFVTDRKDVIAIVRTNTSSPSSLLNTTTNEIPPTGFNSKFDSFAWICNKYNSSLKTSNIGQTLCSQMTDDLEKTANQQWQSGGYDIDYCLSEKIEADCHVHFAPQIMAPVLFFNIVKVLIIAYVAFFYKDKPLVTLGDAIESFSLQPDHTTQGMCLATSEMVEKYWVKGYPAPPVRYDGKGRRWLQAATKRQWMLFSCVFGAAAVAVGSSIALGIKNSEPNTIGFAWSLGIGKVRTQNLITGLQVTSLGPNAVFVSALVANSPQTLFSFIYLIYNNVFTTMVLSAEWDRFSIKSGTGRNLRVSEPRGEQKSTYVLQIPYRYAIVMLSTSGVLHWLVSQSVFLANISVIPLDGIKPKNDEITTCAYSIKAMIFVLVLGIFMLVWVFGNGIRRFTGGMPFVGTNSAAISAACHSEYGLRCEREAMVLKPLRWGVIDFGYKESSRASMIDIDLPPLSLVNEDSSKSGFFDKKDMRYEESRLVDQRLSNMPVGHCAFTDGQVGKPISGRYYA